MLAFNDVLCIAFGIVLTVSAILEGMF